MSSKIAVFSDIHDHSANLHWLFEQIEALEPMALICCGDISSPETLEKLAALGLPLHFCLGNTDEFSAQALMQISMTKPQVYFGARQGQASFMGKKAAFTHYPEIAENLARGSEYQAVFFGHSHQRYMEMKEGVLLANPGDIQNRHGDGPSFLLWDPASMNAEFIIQT